MIIIIIIQLNSEERRKWKQVIKNGSTATAEEANDWIKDTTKRNEGRHTNKMKEILHQSKRKKEPTNTENKLVIIVIVIIQKSNMKKSSFHNSLSSKNKARGEKKDKAFNIDDDAVEA